MKRKYILKCVARNNLVIGYLKIGKNIGYLVERENDATKFDFDEALSYKRNAYNKEGFNCQLVIVEAKAKPEEVKIPGYTLHGDYYLTDKVISNKTWEEAMKLKELIVLPNGKTVIAHTLSKEELETIPQEERKISENGHYWYWTSTPDGDSLAWDVSSTGYFLSYGVDNSGDFGGARLGFKNPFLKEELKEETSYKEINSSINEVMDLFDYELVHKVMELLDWKWAGKGVPEIYDLRVESRKLLEEAAKKVIEGEEYYFAGTGGFKAEAWKNDKGKLELRLNFILEECEN